VTHKSSKMLAYTLSKLFLQVGLTLRTSW